ncbi:MAG: peptidylprolyl isomerase [Armatimonadota bacterium]|nr:peptidylprolyl isomerase [Armatimonadota bacterium]
MQAKRILILIAVVIAISAIPAFCAKPVPDVVATVNGEKITKKELENILFDWSGPLALEELIDHRLIGQEARKQGVIVTAEEVKKKMEESKKFLPPGMSLEEALQRSGMTAGHWFARLKAQMQAEGIVRKTIKITDEDLSSQVKVSRILIKVPYKQEEEEKKKAEQEAQEKIAKISQEIKEGLAFDEAAKKYSEDLMTKEKGGDMGYVPKNTMGKEFEEAIAKLKPGDVSDPFKTAIGYQIVKYFGSGKEATGNERKELVDRLTNMQLQQKMNDWFLTLRNKAKIVNYLSPQPPKKQEQPEVEQPKPQEKPTSEQPKESPSGEPTNGAPPPGVSDAEAASTPPPPPTPPSP